MNHVALMLYLSKSLSRRWVPMVPAQRPLLISLVESSPPYDPSQPATACVTIISLLNACHKRNSYHININAIANKHSLFTHGD